MTLAIPGRLSYSHNINPVSRPVSPPMSDPTSHSRKSCASTNQHPNQNRFRLRPDRISHIQPVEEKRPVRIPASVSAREFSLWTQCSKLEVFCRFCYSVENVAAAGFPFLKTKSRWQDDRTKAIVSIGHHLPAVSFPVVAFPLLSNGCRQVEPKDLHHDRFVSQDPRSG